MIWTMYTQYSLSRIVEVTTLLQDCHLQLWYIYAYFLDLSGVLPIITMNVGVIMLYKVHRTMVRVDQINTQTSLLNTIDLHLCTT